MSDAEPAPSQRDAPLPLGALDTALSPVRRVVRYAMQRGAQPRFFEVNVRRHLDRALALDLPAALREGLVSVAAQIVGFDAAAPSERDDRLSKIYAGLARLDAVAGLPMRHVWLDPVRKPRQRDAPETESSRADPALPPAPEVGSAAPPPVEEDSPLAGLRPALAAKLPEAGPQSVGDLLFRPPVDFEVFDQVRGAGTPLPAGRVAVGGRLSDRVATLGPGGTRVDSGILTGAGPMPLTWVAGAAVPMEDGAGLVVVATHTDGRLVDAEVCSATDGTARVARYQIDGLDEVVARHLVSAAAPVLEGLRDPVSADVLQRLGLPALSAAWAGVHAGEAASARRLAFDEALLVQLAGMLPRARAGADRGIPHALLHTTHAVLAQTLDVTLDDPAQRCFEDIKRELRRATPMRRVVTGEVGGHKGRIGLFAAVMVAAARTQVMMLYSDDASAAQAQLHSEKVLHAAGLVSKAIVGAPTGSQRDAIRRGEVHVLFGSISLLECAIEFRRLGLVVASEREQWGRVGALHAQLPAPRPDLLVTTAVPVGAQILVTAYADHDVSVLVDPERVPAAIRVLPANAREQAYDAVRVAVAAGHQAAVIFPMVRGVDALDLREAYRVVGALESDLLAGLRVGLLHGAMSPDEQRRLHADLQHRRVDVVVSTARLEDGPCVPGATAVIIEQADAVDQWRLHRIIGFFSRAVAPAQAVLVVGKHADSEAAARVARVESAPDGATLTESSIDLLGIDSVVHPGGPPLPTLSWLDLQQHRDVVLAARAEAQRIVHADPGLRRGSHAELGRMLVHRWPALWPDAPDWQAPSLDLPPPPGRRRRRRRRKR